MRIRMLGQYVHAATAMLAIVEFLILCGALLAAAVLRFRGNIASIEQGGPLWARILLFAIVMAISLLAFGLYSSRQRALAVGIVVRLAAAIAAGTAVTAVCFYLLPNLWIGRGVIGIAAFIAFTGITLSRSIFARVGDEVALKRRVLVYGCGRRAVSIASLRRRSDRRGFVVIGYVRPDGEDEIIPAGNTLQPQGTLLSTCRQHNVDEVVVAMEDRRRGFPILDLLECRMDGVDVTELLTFLERETGRVRLDVLDPSWMIFGTG